MKKIYFIISYLCVFGFYSHGESFNIKAQFFFFLFFTINFCFSIYYNINKNKVLVNNFFLISLLFFFTIYGFIVNGLQFKIITDILQIANIFLISQIIRELNQTEIKRFLKISSLLAVFAGIYSFIFLGLSNERFAPVSYIVPITSYFYYQKKESKWIQSVIILISFLLILLSGRRANLFLSLIGMLFVLFIFRKQLAILLFSIIFLLYLNKGTIFDYLKKSEYPTLQRIGMLGKDDQSMGTRYKEVNTVFNKFSEEGTLLTYIFGFGAAEYYQFERIWDLEYEDRHHIHFTPVNLYFRHGIFGVFLMLIVFYKVIKLILLKKDDYYKLLTILIVMTIIDSMFRSLFVEFYGIFFMGMSLILYDKVKHSGYIVEENNTHLMSQKQ